MDKKTLIISVVFILFVSTALRFNYSPSFTGLVIDFSDIGCETGDERPCGSNVGVCEAGIRSCVDGEWGDCVGDIKPSEELCNGLDDNCNDAWIPLYDLARKRGKDCLFENRSSCMELVSIKSHCHYLGNT